MENPRVSKPKAKTPAKAPLGKERGSVVAELFAVPLQLFHQLWKKANNLAQTNYELGCDQIARGFFNEALFRFKIATWLEPNHFLAWYNMGCCYLSKEKRPEAIAAFRRALSIRPGYEEARFMLATIDPKIVSKEPPLSMPVSLVINQFADEARDYMQLHVIDMGYKGHLLLHEQTFKFIDKNRTDYAMLDLGCGTGLCGMVFRPQAQTLAGVDLTPEMVMYARELRDAAGRKIYDIVHEMDMRKFLLKLDENSFDIIFSANALNYVGDLASTFDGVAKSLKPGGIFSFSTETSDHSTGFHLIPAIARFGHSKAYIQEQATRVGMEVLSMENAIAYTDYTMLQCVLRKP